MTKRHNMRNLIVGLAAIATLAVPSIAGAGEQYRRPVEMPNPGYAGTYDDSLDLEAVGSGSYQEPDAAHWRGQRDYGKFGGRRHGDYRRSFCSPREAIEKAYRYGLNRPQIHRISPDVIVVAGRNYGHWARIVFARWSPYCQVVGSRGI